MKTEGTPKYLPQAIANGMDINISENTNGSIDIRIDRDLYVHIRDFISQKFTVAAMKHPDQDELLMNLFNELVNRGAKMKNWKQIDYKMGPWGDTHTFEVTESDIKIFESGPVKGCEYVDVMGEYGQKREFVKRVNGKAIVECYISRGD